MMNSTFSASHAHASYSTRTRARGVIARGLCAFPLPLLLAVLVTFLLIIASPAAFAGALDDARQAGHVGEKADGYIALVNAEAPADVKALVQDINKRRKAKYAELSKKNGVPVDAIEAQMGDKLIKKAAGGTYIQNSAGKWVKK